MPKKQREIECVITFTEGYEQRFTNALLEIYRQRQGKANMTGEKNLDKEKLHSARGKQMEEVRVQGTELRIKEYAGKRVVTFKDIDTVHRRPLGTASRNFNQNLVRFIEGKDFYNVKLTDNEIRRAYGVGINQGNIKVITETGYLMLVKSFMDDRHGMFSVIW